jgi:hypothetical protein
MPGILGDIAETIRRCPMKKRDLRETDSEEAWIAFVATVWCERGPTYVIAQSDSVH